MLNWMQPRLWRQCANYKNGLKMFRQILLCNRLRRGFWWSRRTPPFFSRDTVPPNFCRDRAPDCVGAQVPPLFFLNLFAPPPSPLTIPGCATENGRRVGNSLRVRVILIIFESSWVEISLVIFLNKRKWDGWLESLESLPSKKENKKKGSLELELELISLLLNSRNTYRLLRPYKACHHCERLWYT